MVRFTLCTTLALALAGCSAAAPVPPDPPPAASSRSPSRHPEPYPKGIPWEGEALKQIDWNPFAPKAPADRSDQFLTIAVPNEPATWDPHKAWDDVDKLLARSCFEGLVTRHPADCRPIPAIAEWWDVSPDRKVYTFHLRANARWSDGTAITAADVKWSLARALDQATESPGRELLSSMLPVAAAAGLRGGDAGADAPATELQVVGERTLRITLPEPDPRFVHALAETSAVVVHRGSVEAHGKKAFEAEHLVASGAFTLGAGPKGGATALSRNPNHWMQARVALSGAVLTWPKEEGAPLLPLYERGAVDWVPWCFAPAEKRVWTDGVYTTEGAAIQFLLLNTGALELRRAMAASVDEKAIDYLADGGGARAERLIPAAFPGYPPVKPLQRTRDAHTKGPVPSDDTTLQFLVPNYLAARKAAAVMIRRWAMQLGVRAAVVPLSAGALLERVAAGEFDVAMAGHSEPLPHPFGILESPFLQPMLRSEDGVAALLERAHNGTPSGSLSACAGLEQLLLHDRARVAPLLRSRSVGVISPRITGLTPNVLDEHRLRYFRVETDKQ